ncbi:MAG: DM13 domain-containing protein [Pseudomonadota bacterium]
MLLAEGTFEGRGGHALKGEFVVEQVGDRQRFTTSEDFYFDGSPAPGFALSATGNVSAEEAIETDFLRLPGTGSTAGPQLEVPGRQMALLPKTIDIVQIKYVFLWCYRFPSLLGVARLDIVDH